MQTELRISEKVKVEIPVVGETTGKWMFKSIVMEADDSFIYLAAPIFKGKEYPLQAGRQVQVFYYRDSGLYSFEAVYNGRVLVGNVASCQVKRTSEIKRTQRREYFRLTCVLTAQLKSRSTGTVAKALIPDVEAIIHDISGSGVRAISRKQFQENEEIECTLYLDPKVLTVSATVLRCAQRQEENNYEMGIRFDQINEADRDQIMAFIFRRQMELRQKGLV